MRWIRSNMRLGAWCALFALALQLALSFGHVHLDGGLKSPRSGLTALFAKTVPAAIPDVPALPSSHDPNGQAADFCDICALIHLAGTLVPAASPALPLPAVFSLTPLPIISADRELAASRPFSFRARAPPLA
jgi:hypothetical protein